MGPRRRPLPYLVSYATSLAAFMHEHEAQRFARLVARIYACGSHVSCRSGLVGQYDRRGRVTPEFAGRPECQPSGGEGDPA